MLHLVFCRAIQAGSLQLVTALIDFGADVNLIPENDKSLCPLLLALDDNDTSILRLLLNKGAYVNIRKSSYGHTPLTHAALKGKVNVVRVLLSYNADMYTQAAHLTALSLATIVGRALLDQGNRCKSCLTNRGDCPLVIF